MARKRTDQAAESPLDVAPERPPQATAPQRPDCLTCPLKECRGKFAHAKSDMGGGRMIHYHSCTVCGTGNSVEVKPEA